MQQQNPFDRAVSDFFHSKTFRTVLIIAFTLCLAGLCIFFLISRGILQTSAIPWILPPTTSAPQITSAPWRWVTLQPYDIHVEIPNEWTMQEKLTDVIGGVGYGPNHDYCSDVLFTSADKNDNLLLSALCVASDTSFNSCPSYDFVNYGKGFVRVPMEDKNSFAYTEFDLSTGQCLDPPWWTVSDNESGLVFYIIQYWEFDKPRQEIYDFTIPDRIVQSIYK